MNDNFSQDAYDAAFRQLSGRFNGDIAATAEKVVDELQARQEIHGIGWLLRLSQHLPARRETVNAVMEASGVTALIDEATRVAAYVLWDSEKV